MHGRSDGSGSLHEQCGGRVYKQAVVDGRPALVARLVDETGSTEPKVLGRYVANLEAVIARFQLCVTNVRIFNEAVQGPVPRAAEQSEDATEPHCFAAKMGRLIDQLFHVQGELKEEVKRLKQLV